MPHLPCSSHDARSYRLTPPQGHGWWPGRVVEDSFERPANLAKGTVAVSFFDNTSGWLPRHGCLPFVENFEALHSRKAKLPAFLAASRVCAPRSVRAAQRPCSDACTHPAQMARRAWNEMQASLAPAEDAMPLAEVPVPKRLRSSLGTGGARVTRLGALGARRLGTGARPRSAYNRAGRHVAGRSRGATTGRKATRRAGQVSLHGVAVDLGGMTRRLVELDARLNPLVTQAQSAVVAQLRLLPVRSELTKAGTLGEEVEMQERKLLLSQLLTLHTVIPRIRGELVELELAHGVQAEPLPAYVTPPPVPMRRAHSVSCAEQHEGGADDAGMAAPAEDEAGQDDAEILEFDHMDDEHDDDAGMDDAAPFPNPGAETSSSHSDQ